MIESMQKWLQGVRNKVGHGLISRLLKPRVLASDRLMDFSRLKKGMPDCLFEHLAHLYYYTATGGQGLSPNC